MEPPEVYIGISSLKAGKRMNWENGAGLNRNLPKLSDKQKEKIRNGEKIMVGEEQRTGWSGKLPFYIFWCGECENFSYDYPHGFIESQHLNCHRCSLRIDFRPWWVEWKMLFQAVKCALTIRFGGRK